MEATIVKMPITAMVAPRYQIHIHIRYVYMYAHYITTYGSRYWTPPTYHGACQI